MPIPFANCTKPLLSEPLPAVTSATQIFANAPIGTYRATLTVRGGDLTMTFDGVTVPTVSGTAGSVGIDYLQNSPYEFPMERGPLLLINAISANGATGYIQYWGVN